MKYSSLVTGVFLLLLAGPGLASDEAGELPESITVDMPERAPALPIEAVVRSADAPGAIAPLKLNHADQLGDWMLTYHTGKARMFGGDYFHSRVAIHHETEDGYILKAQWFSGVLACLEKPRFFTALHKGRFIQMLWVPGLLYGTGSLRQDALFHLTDKGQLQPVEFEPAPIGYERLSKAGVPGAIMHAGEGVWKGEFNVIHRPTIDSQDQMSFSFSIWNADDGNANPTAGRVDGTYKLTENENGFKLEIDSFKRKAIEKP